MWPPFQNRVTCCRMIAQTGVQYESRGGEKYCVQWINDVLERLTGWFTKLSDNRRAAVLGALFGLLMCVIVVLIIAVIGLVADIGQ